MRKSEIIQLSIVATIYNSSQIIPSLVERIANAAHTIGVTYEIILVDDGSRDDSAIVMESISNADPRVKSIILSRNFGQQIAMSAGIHHANGEFVLIMDGDLQNPPEAIADLYHEALKGFDIVYTKSIKKNNLLDSLTSLLFWKFLKIVMRVDIVDSQLMMRIMTSRVARLYRDYPEKIRTVAAITHDIGMKRSTIQVENGKREYGKSNYSTRKRLSLALDVILDFSNKPLDFVFTIGLFTLAATIVAMIYYLYSYLKMSVLPGFTSLILFIMFFGSINLISIGVLARYISNIYTEVKRRPLYLIFKTINIDHPHQISI